MKGMYLHKIIRSGSISLRFVEILRGHGTTEIEGEVVATVCGVIEHVNKLVYVFNLRARYKPEVGDIIVGRVLELAVFLRYKPEISRGRKPDGVFLVVGSCCHGFKENSNSDVIFSSAEAKQVGRSEAQYFWEYLHSNLVGNSTIRRSPAGSGLLDRTTYMFTYVEPKPSSSTIDELLEDYLGAVNMVRVQDDGDMDQSSGVEYEVSN
ncbi:hypothetical protein CTI12_AA078090 [Artemisia annua]|uniref:Uncharacterized protein n=1 Tax=Artemisia annua TaxID=35608 RepID=A0A2U1Q3P9_ARTAN|nr:hypothetical protein CTI12_AA078090 [Artemisia annua]